MNNRLFHLLPPIGLLIGSLLGLSGTFVPSESLRGLLWGIDGMALIMAVSMLVIYHIRQNNDLLAAGFLIFLALTTIEIKAS